MMVPKIILLLPLVLLVIIVHNFRFVNSQSDSWNYDSRVQQQQPSQNQHQQQRGANNNNHMYPSSNFNPQQRGRRITPNQRFNNPNRHTTRRPNPHSPFPVHQKNNRIPHPTTPHPLRRSPSNDMMQNRPHQPQRHVPPQHWQNRPHPPQRHVSQQWQSRQHQPQRNMPQQWQNRQRQQQRHVPQHQSQRHIPRQWQNRHQSQQHHFKPQRNQHQYQSTKRLPSIASSHSSSSSSGVPGHFQQYSSIPSSNYVQRYDSMDGGGGDGGLGGPSNNGSSSSTHENFRYKRSLDDDHRSFQVSSIQDPANIDLPSEQLLDNDFEVNSNWQTLDNEKPKFTFSEIQQPGPYWGITALESPSPPTRQQIETNIMWYILMRSFIRDILAKQKQENEEMIMTQKLKVTDGDENHLSTFYS